MKHPFETKSDSFYFVNNDLIMHNKVCFVSLLCLKRAGFFYENLDTHTHTHTQADYSYQA